MGIEITDEAIYKKAWAFSDKQEDLPGVNQFPTFWKYIPQIYVEAYKLAQEVKNKDVELLTMAAIHVDRLLQVAGRKCPSQALKSCFIDAYIAGYMDGVQDL